MKYLLLLCSLLFSSLFFTANAQDTIKQSENIFVEMSANMALYNSLSISVEKEFTYGKFTFGPRVELINIFGDESYIAEKVDFEMIAQIRVRLLQLEYQMTDRIRIGVTPFWMLGPLPKRGVYKIPSSVYTHIQIKEGLSLETSLTNTNRELFQLSLRKVL